jgi:hypothetical protein
MVREVVLRGLPQAWVLVDDLSPADDAAERALSLSASVALRLLRTGHTVRLVRLDGRGAGESRFEPAGGPTPLLEAFARVQLPTPGTVGSPGMPGAVGAVGAVGGGGAVGQDGEDLTAALSHRLLSGVGTRGAVAPIYGALAQVSEQTAGELGRLASVARPGWLWLTGSSSEVETTLRRQGWTVEAAQ